MMLRGRVQALVVEEDEQSFFRMRDSLCDVSGEQYELRWARSPEQALEIVNADFFDVCFLDQAFAGAKGTKFVKSLDISALDIPIVLLTSREHAESAPKPLVAGAYDFVVKDDLKTHTLERSIRYAMERRGYERQMRARVDALTAAHALVENQRRQLIEANEKLSVLASEDSLTGLRNRRYFEERLEEELHRARRYREDLSLAVADIDFFKSYNDKFGHAQGDEILRMIGRIIAGVVRECDIVARYGGEEFVIVLPHADQARSFVVAERVRYAVEVSDWLHGKLTVSVGVATLHHGGQTATELFAAADRALYRAKSQGRNRVCHAEDTLSPSEQKGLRI